MAIVTGFFKIAIALSGTETTVVIAFVPLTLPSFFWIDKLCEAKNEQQNEGDGNGFVSFFHRQKVGRFGKRQFISCGFDCISKRRLFAKRKRCFTKLTHELWLSQFLRFKTVQAS